MKSNKIATIAIHGGNQTDKGNNAIFPPIVTASSFIQPNLGESGEFFYSRCGNPTRNAYETALAELEGGIYATATASGMAATSLALEVLSKDAHVIVMSSVYGGTYRLFESLRTRTSGLEFSYVNLNDLDAVTAEIRDNTALIWIETPTNPLLELVDVEAICDLAKQHNITTCVDNTFSTAWNQRPFDLGADMVMLSTSKYIGGHSDVIGGALITNNPELATQINAYKTTVGAIASPFDSYLALRGLKTLDVRMERHCANALKVAKFLENHPKITEVHYPGLASHPQHALCQRQMKTGGAVVTIRLAGGEEQVRQFIAKLRYFVLAESLGGVESMINHTASMSHGSVPKQEREAMGIYFETLRLSIGIEDADDLIDDLQQALEG
ncbi:PLP-dependent aspartate aminotransferase family protein [Vibrio scophthalmi]|uniref:Cystathionine gamma-synthase n=1 Tax=Vibrio scophthalmi TaxID=45658 RepID=A0A1E3WQD4_9VIBR|nr:MULTISPECIES: PLP-dependent aspartate aminotransferase family protein [Vibrio]EGU30335.1 cystathionine gamma-synthase [Vibrio sp. N418]MCY9802175.1 PLP-dependent aspartate aminotransferase family protein [Vibrio scophthalmi]ODS11981.1 Cystathionine gamma-synthase [Vibrio scophthalmi]